MFPVFFRWRAMHENASKGLHESTKNCWSSFQNVNLERQSPLGVFLRDKTVFNFFDRGAWRHVCNTRTCTQKMSYFHVFHEKGRLSLSAKGKNITFSRKNTIFPDNTRKIMCRRGPFWKDHLFRKFEENIIFLCIFLRQIIFQFLSKV